VYQRGVKIISVAELAIMINIPLSVSPEIEAGSRHHPRKVKDGDDCDCQQAK